MSKRKKRNNNSENSMNKLVANTENIAQNSMETNKGHEAFSRSWLSPS